MKYRIWTDISNAIYEAGTRVAEWIKRDGNKNDKRIWAVVKGIEAYTKGYIEAEKERLKGTDMEKKKGTRVFGLMETKLQELVAGLGIPAERDSGGTDTRVEEVEERLQQLQRRYDQCEKLARTLLEEKQEKEEQEQEDLTLRVMDSVIERRKQESRYQVLVGEKEMIEARLREKEEQLLEAESKLQSGTLRVRLSTGRMKN